MSYKNGPNDIFHALENVIDILEEEGNGKELSSDLELAFRLINAEKYDKRYRRQFARTIKKISDKNPKLADAVGNLEITAIESPEIINFDLLTKYGTFCRKKLEKNGFIHKNLPESKRTRGFTKSKNLSSLYIEE